MDGETIVLLRMLTEGGSFCLLCFLVVWVVTRGAPKHFANQRELAETMRATLADQRKAHAEERGYLRDTQEQQHRENVEALARMARAIAGQKTKRPDVRSNPDDRPREA